MRSLFSRATNWPKARATQHRRSQLRAPGVDDHWRAMKKLASYQLASDQAFSNSVASNNRCGNSGGLAQDPCVDIRSGQPFDIPNALACSSCKLFSQSSLRCIAPPRPVTKSETVSLLSCWRIPWRRRRLANSSSIRLDLVWQMQPALRTST